MIPPEGFHPLERGIPGMDGIMHAAVHQVTQEEAREKHECIAAHDQVHQPEKAGRNDQAGYGRHEQPLLIARIMMMVAVQCIYKLGGTRRLGHPVKNKTVCDVLKQGPEQHTPEKNEEDGTRTVIVFGGSEVNNITENGNIHPPDHQRMRLGQGFQKIVFKEPGLPFIMDFFKMHGAKIRNESGAENCVTG